MKLIHTIRGGISPKSVVHSGAGLFFVQNMMYRHTITVYDRRFRLVGTMPDAVPLAAYGYGKRDVTYKGAPVEAAFRADGREAWVSNYRMFGPGFTNPGNDSTSGTGFDRSFIYRVGTKRLAVDAVVPVGSVPKYVAVTPDGARVLVTNWCSGDLSVLDAARAKEIRRVRLGRHPRGITVDASSKTAYVAVMGSSDIAMVDLGSFAVGWMRGVGSAPRHLCLDPGGESLYATLNGEGTVAKIAVAGGKVLRKVATGRAPRSMILSRDGQFLYVVNYHSDTVSKVRTADLRVLATVPTDKHPIGITYDPQTRQVWVACYSGSILVFQD